MGRWPRTGVLALGPVLALGLAGAAQAECRLALALAFDVSRSVSARDYAIQREGLLAALADPVVIAAFLHPKDHVALALYEWSRNTHQVIVLDWTEVRSAADLAAVRARIAAHERSSASGTTALGEALRFGRALVARAPDCADQVIDVSGDGQNNSGMAPATVYAQEDFGLLRVNGLAILAYERDVVRYYREEVIRGPGAFIEIADSPRDFPRAIRRKLLRELTERIIGGVPAGWLVAGRSGERPDPLASAGVVDQPSSRTLLP